MFVQNHPVWDHLCNRCSENSSFIDSFILSVSHDPHQLPPAIPLSLRLGSVDWPALVLFYAGIGVNVRVGDRALASGSAVVGGSGAGGSGDGSSGDGNGGGVGVGCKTR
jgi:hypothetical protein